jgi:hypothetical protein
LFKYLEDHWHVSITAGASTDAPLSMVETDFSVKNAAAFEKNSSLNTSLIVNYIQFALIAALTSVVAYQYKGI